MINWPIKYLIINKIAGTERYVDENGRHLGKILMLFYPPDGHKDYCKGTRVYQYTAKDIAEIRMEEYTQDTLEKLRKGLEDVAAGRVTSDWREHLKSMKKKRKRNKK